MCVGEIHLGWRREANTGKRIASDRFHFADATLVRRRQWRH